MRLPSYQLVTTTHDWQTCLAQLRQEKRLAIDLEANSLYAYQERICLIQISIPDYDFIIDPVAHLDLTGLGQIIQDPDVEKVFHAAEYDLILMKREHNWKLENLFDTMWAARILGYARVGLANMLEQFYDVRLNKKYQKANWCKRPLSSAQLTYAQMDTHFLLRLRDNLAQQLEEAGCLAEAKETFAEQTTVHPSSNTFDPDSFWSMSGIRDLTRRQQAIVKALFIYRDEQARRQNRPHFKVFGDRTILELAQKAPQNLATLDSIHGMTKGQIRRYGRQVLQVIRDAEHASLPERPRRTGRRQPEAVIARYEKLHNWRKERAQARGVESDVIISRDALWKLAQANPRTEADLVDIDALGPWRRQTYAAEILRVLKE